MRNPPSWKLAVLIGLLLASLIVLSLGCTPERTERIDRSVDLPLEVPHRTLPPHDCRDAWACTQRCLGAGFLDHELAVDMLEECADHCAPIDVGEGDHWQWYRDAVDVAECDDDECVWAQLQPPLDGSDGLSGTVLLACLQPRD